MDHLLAQLNWLTTEQPAMLALVEELCNQNSGTFNLAGLAAVCEKLIAEFSVLGGQISVMPTQPMQTVADDGTMIAQPLGSMIHIRKWPAATRRVLLCIHMDTVYPAEHPFQKCVWLPDGSLNGPGVADAKGGLTVMLFALRALEQSSLAGKIGWDVLINPDEEIGSFGSYSMIETLAPLCDFGLLFEPSLPDGTLVSWRKGSGNFTFVVRGRAAHAGRDFESGRNAIVALSRLMSAIADRNIDPDVTLNVGRVSGGGPLNVVPDLAIGRVNVRIKTAEQKSSVLSEMARLTAEFNQLDGISVEMFGEFSSPPKPHTSDVAELQQRIEGCAATLDIPVHWQGTGGACDGNKFAAAGLPNIDTLGPCGGNIHSSAEYLLPASLVPRAKLAALILLSYADEQ